MPTIVDDNFDHKLDQMVEVAKALHKEIPELGFSIECAENPWITFSQLYWNDDSATTIQKICEQFGRSYVVEPLSGKLGVLIQ